jgi:hypothetical protein
MSGFRLSAKQHQVLTHEVFTGEFEQVVPNLERVMGGEPPLVLCVSDRNTKGLGGPVDGNSADPNRIYDWRHFVLDMGHRNTDGHTGGTYGFGKTIAYIVSKAGTVLIHSRALGVGSEGISSRFIACAIGHDFDLDGLLYTGRHFWGVNESGGARPLTGAAADELARRLGFPEFADDETGTTLMILDPDLGERTEQQAATFLAESILWNLWPKMLERDGMRPMRVTMTWGGDYVPISDPADRPPLDGFARAYRAILDGVSSDSPESIGLQLEVVGLRAPRLETGDLAYAAMRVRDRPQVDDGHDPDDDESPPPAAPIVGSCHHVAFLRTPELVVTYEEHARPASGSIEWAGVFRCRPDVDSFFAESEPPTHDQWDHGRLPARSTPKRVVKVTKEKIRDLLDRRWAPEDAGDKLRPSSVARVANDLGDLVFSQRGLGPGQQRSSRAGSRPQAGSVKIAAASVILLDGEPATRFVLTVTPAPNARSSRLAITAGVSLDGREQTKAELDPDLSLREMRGELTVVERNRTSALIDVESDGPGEVELDVRRGPDTSVLLTAVMIAQDAVPMST